MDSRVFDMSLKAKADASAMGPSAMLSRHRYNARMGIDEILTSKRDEILRIAAKHGVSSIRVFGSVARGDAGPKSDVDFLIETEGVLPPSFPGGLSLPTSKSYWDDASTSPRPRG